METFLLIIHVLICLLLGTIILMQSGRGGGLTESFAQAGEMFGAKTNEMLTRATTILSCVFFVTCLALAVMSAQRGKSLMSSQAVEVPAAPAAPFESASEEVPLGDLPEAPAATVE